MDLITRATFTDEQKEYLLGIADECVTLGASKDVLAPLYALIFVSFPQPELSEEEILLGRKIAECLGLKDEPE